MLHFATDHKRKLRWLAHFYSFLWWEDAADERHCKRFARDALRYRDDIFCAAAPIVAALRADAAALARATNAVAGSSSSSSSTSTSTSTSSSSSSEGRHYSSFHIRRGDFQFKAAKIPVEAILQSVGHLLEARELVYVATDEEDDTAWLDPIRAAGHTVKSTHTHTLPTWRLLRAVPIQTLCI